MTDHTVKSFTEELEVLSGEVSRMGGLAEAMTADALQAVARRDTALARQVITRDQALDDLQVELERQVIRLVALRQPLAQDLRRTIAALKISSDLERIGDLAKNIAKRTVVLNESEPIFLTNGVERMGKMVIGHLKEVLDAYHTGETDRAMTVWARDEEVDEHYNTLFKDLLTYMKEDPRKVDECAHLLFVSKNIERIGDHATNIAEIVHFLFTGRPMEQARPKSESIGEPDA